MNAYLTMLNLISGGIVFINCVCRLSVRRWAWQQPELWAYALMIGGSVGVLSGGFVQVPLRNISEVIINCGLAAYFVGQSWRLRHMKRSGYFG